MRIIKSEMKMILGRINDRIKITGKKRVVNLKTAIEAVQNDA